MSRQKNLGVSKESFTLTLCRKLTIPLIVTKNTLLQPKGSLVFDPVELALFYSDGSGWIEVTDSTTNTQCIVNESGDTSVCTDTEPPTDSKIIYFTTDAILRAIFQSGGAFVATAGSVDPTTVVVPPGEAANFQGNVSIVGELILTIPLSESSGGTGQNTYATGDTLYASGVDTLSKLPIGTADQVYTVSGGVPSWQDPQIIQTGPEVPNTQANGDDYEFLPVDIDGNSRYIPLTSTPALNAQNDGGKLICMGTDVVGGPSGTAYTKLQAAANPSQIIGSTACQSWNAATTTTGGLSLYGRGILQNTSATSAHQDEIIIGYTAMWGNTTPYTSTSSQNVIIGNTACQNYQYPNGGVIIGHGAMVSKPVTSSDGSRVAIGASVLGSTTNTGGSNSVIVGARAMQLCTAILDNSLIAIGVDVLRSASGRIENENIVIGRACQNTVFAANAHRNVFLGSNLLSGATSAANSNNVLLGCYLLDGNACGIASNTVVIGSETFRTLGATMASNVVSIGSTQTGTPSASEVMIGRACVAAGVVGRLSFGNAMEAIAATATAGGSALPAAPAGFLVIRHNGTVRKLPVYNN